MKQNYIIYSRKYTIAVKKGNIYAIMNIKIALQQHQTCISHEMPHARTPSAARM